MSNFTAVTYRLSVTTQKVHPVCNYLALRSLMVKVRRSKVAYIAAP
jgi:hypothetical protein